MGRVNAKKGSRLKSKNKKIKLKFRARLIIFIFLLIIFILIFKNIKNKNISEIKLDLIIDNNNITSSLEKEILIKDNIIYLSLDDIKKTLDNNIYQEKDLIITTGHKKVAALKLDNSSIETNGVNTKIKGQAFKNEAGEIYLPVSELKNVYDVDITYIEQSKNIVVDYFSRKLEKAYTNKKVEIKEEPKLSSNTLEELNRGIWLVYVSNEKGWAKVRTQNGFVGYIQYKNLTNFVTEREDMIPVSSVPNDFYEVDITKKDISTYNKRKKLINNILQKAVANNKKAIKIINEKESQEYDRFKIELEPILNECGITLQF